MSAPVALSINQEGRLRKELAARGAFDDAARFHVGMALGWIGGIDVTAFERALNAVIARHDTLRASFHRRADTVAPVLQRIAVTAPVRVMHVAHHAPRAAADAMAAMNRPFDYGTPPLVRAAVIEEPDGHAVYIVSHHLVVDAASMRVVRSELEQLYVTGRGDPSDRLPPPTLQYSEFARGQRALLSGEHGQAAIAYWKREWRRCGRHLIHVGTLPIGKRSPVTVGEMARDAIDVPAPVVRRWQTIAASDGLTLFMIGLTGLLLTLRSLSGRNRLAVWTTVANRVDPARDRLIGWVANAHIVGVDLAGETMQGALEQVRAGVHGLLAHQELPGAAVRDALAADPELSDLADVNAGEMVWFACRARPDDTSCGDAIVRALPDAVMARRALTVMLELHADGATLAAHYDSSRVEASSIRPLLTATRSAMQEAVDHVLPATHVHTLTTASV